MGRTSPPVVRRSQGVCKQFVRVVARRTLRVSLPLPMRWPAVRSRDLLRLAAVSLAVLLLALATLQYRWLREIAESQRQRMRADAAHRAASIAQDFDREMTRAFLLLQLDAETVKTRDASAYAARFADYRAKARWPGLVKDVYAYARDHEGRGALLRFVPERRVLAPSEWPAGLASLRRALEAGLPPHAAVQPEGPVLVAPVAEVVAGAAGSLAEVPRLRGALTHVLVQRRLRGLSASLIVLDGEHATREVLPRLAAERLGGEDGTEYAMSVAQGATGRHLAGVAPAGPGDAQAELLRLRLDDIDAAILQSFVPDVLRPSAGPGRVTIRLSESVTTGRAGPGLPDGRWQLTLHHRDGSVDRAVARALARNLAVSGGILAVLGGGIAVLALTARRARALAARQMEFVASVSHELRTPLAVIRGAGENLADGVVSEGGQVRRYGGVIRDEGLRLSEMVEQVLTFAGADAAARTTAPVDLGRVVDRVLEADAAAGGAPVPRETASDLPRVEGDAASLERAVANLVSNARKYGGPEGPVIVRVRGVPGPAVAVTVADRGPGLDPEEKERLFEPFFRGRRAREAQAPGSGLGLAVVRRIVDAHRGRIDVASTPGQGTSFTLVLPALPAAVDRPAPRAHAHPAR